MRRSSLLGLMRSLVAGFLACALGCDRPAIEGDAGALPDAGTPSAPAPPSWGACPSGWASADVEGAQICLPPARLTCTGATFQPVGSAACEAVDLDCTAARYREERATDRSYVFVDASAALGGDGSEAAPFRTLDDALRGVRAPAGILLAAGDYGITAALPADVDIRGVCADRTRLIAAAGRPAILVSAGQRASLVGLTITGVGIGPAARGTLVLDRVVLEGLDGWGAGVNGGRLEARRLLVRAPTPSPGSAVGLGLSLIDGASAQLTDVVIEDAHGVGIGVEAATLVAERVVIQRVDAEAAGIHGGGLSAVAGSSLTLRESLITEVRDFGIAVQSDSTAVLERVVVRGVTSAPADPGGKGIELRDSMGTLDRVIIERATGSGLFVLGTAAVHASDLLVRDTQLLEDFALGLSVSEGALELDRALVLDTSVLGIAARAGAIVGRDVVVRRVGSSRGWGSALASSDGGSVEITRFSFSDLHTIGVLAVGVNARLILADGSIRGVTPTPEWDIGRGAEAHTGGHLSLRSVIIEDVVETAVVAFGGTEAGAIVDGTIAELDDVHIGRISERSCASTTCPTEAGGTGVASLFGATVRADALEVIGAPLCGVQVFDRAALDVTSGSIETSAIGACVQIEGYDLSRIVSGVRFVSNERNVETVGIYVPRPGPSF